MTIAQARSLVESTSAREVVESAIERAQNDSNHALLEIIDERALKRADEVDEKIKQGIDVGELAGVPFVAKDNILTFGSNTTAGSKILENFKAPFQATAIERLESAGAICIGKANLDSFAHGASTENSAYGPTTNPRDSSRVAGGSSGGSSASVALDIVPFALGTDTGGSIRQPASFCGVVGLRPTYGAVSRYGVTAMASSLDVVGPLAHTVEDCMTVMRIISGVDDKDSTTIESPYTRQPENGKKVGVIKELLDDGVEPEIKQAVLKEVERLKDMGYKISDISLPRASYSIPVYYIIVPAEVASNLARYDGIRYGNRPEGCESLSDIYESTRTNGFMPENIRRIMIGNFVLSSGYYDAYFRQAAKVRTLIIEDFAKAFEKVDYLISPTTPSVAFKLGENTSDPIKMYLADQMTAVAPLAGLPAISVPLKVEGLPVGIQIMAPRQYDTSLLELAKVIEEGNK